jgi:LCP family protein required for cell wall assembly
VSDTSTQHDTDNPDHSDNPGQGRTGRRRRIKRIALVSAASLIALVLVIAGGGYFFASHMLSSVHRIHVVALSAPDQPVMPAATSRSVTILLTSGAVGAVQGTLPKSSVGPASGLISLIHLDANQRTGAVISLPPNAIVSIPGHGKKDLGDALAIGGPSLLVKTVERLTDVRINHYSVLSFSGALAVINALGGVDVDVPYVTTSSGHTFHQGTNLVDGHSALAYARQPAISEIGRELLQQNLMRSIMSKIAHKRLFRNPTVDYRLVRALAGALSVDSNMSNSQLASLALSLGNLGSSDGTFVDAPTIGSSATRGGDNPVHLDRSLSQKLWQAIRHDSVAAFALRYPSTVTSTAPD